MNLAAGTGAAANAFPNALMVVVRPQNWRNEDLGVGSRNRNRGYSAVGLAGWRDPNGLEAC